eukprot:765566-Hanusia_phi.AAC.4
MRRPHISLQHASDPSVPSASPAAAPRALQQLMADLIAVEHKRLQLLAPLDNLQKQVPPHVADRVVRQVQA